jgi:hypothetical protein
LKSARPGGATEGGREPEKQQKSQERGNIRVIPGAAQEDRDGGGKRRQYKYLGEKGGHDGVSRKTRGYGRCRSGTVEQKVGGEEPD